MNITLLASPSEKSKVNYIFHVFSNILGIDLSLSPKSDILIYYGEQDDIDTPARVVIHIPQNDHEFAWCEWRVLEEEDRVIISFNFDIIRQSFDWLNRVEEINKQYFVEGQVKDTQIIKKPWVNIYAYQLWDAIKKGCEKMDLEVAKPHNWLGEKDFAVVLTHDVDRIKKWSFRWRMGRLYYGLEGLFRFDFKFCIQQFSDFLKSLLSLKDPFWNFDIIRNLEIGRNIRSTFFFLAESQDINMARYKLTKKLKKVMMNLSDEGFEIGLHGSRYSYNNILTMGSELKKLKKIAPNIQGIRQHYLMFDMSKTWYIQEKCGLVYDSTLGYNNEIGFRCGICHPYKPFNKNLWELPLNIMDVTLFDKKDYSLSKAFKYSTAILEETKRYNGIAVILWHQRTFGDPEHIDFYEKLLDWIESNNGEILTATQAIEKFSRQFQEEEHGDIKNK